MEAFAFDRQVIDRHEKFSRSFTRIRADDLRDEVDRIYREGRFWPDPLLTFNPRYEAGESADELVALGTLEPETAEVFSFRKEGKGVPIRFHRHQAEAISYAALGDSFVVTTGTGSGKSLCFFVPIVDAAIRARKAGEPRRTRAIIVYPMNALANSQREEIEKFLRDASISDNLKPTVARYTGQESSEERERIAADPPDILLTNFMMLELLLTRQNERDRQVIRNAEGLKFIVLDELHTYRGRQGADVAVLIRRLRARTDTGAGTPICIGTSATMASADAVANPKAVVAEVASRLFGVSIPGTRVIDEHLVRATNPDMTVDGVLPDLRKIVEAGFPDMSEAGDLRSHPLAVWAELRLGLKEGQRLERRLPTTLGDAATQLAHDTGASQERCREVLTDFLGRIGSNGTADKTVLAFKLHRFVSGPAELLTGLGPAPRKVWLEGQGVDPENPSARLYPTHFCRSCGQEYHVVTLKPDGDVIPRDIDQPLTNDEEGDRDGYLAPADNLDFDGSVTDYPENWLELSKKGELRLKSTYRKHMIEAIHVLPNGHVASPDDPEARAFWFLPGKFRFCLNCGEMPAQQARERTKLAGLSGEGRSSATTTLTLAMLEAMGRDDVGVPDELRKLLGFTDNRQDAALQAGHFNDFVFVCLLRGSLLRAVEQAGASGLSPREFGRALREVLGFEAERPALRPFWMLNPEKKGLVPSQAAEILAEVLEYRAWSDLRRGWRYTNPNLVETGLLAPTFLGLDGLAADEDVERAAPHAYRELPLERRMKLFEAVLNFTLEGLAVEVDALNAEHMRSVAEQSRGYLRLPWAIDKSEGDDLLRKRTLVLDVASTRKMSRKENELLLRTGVTSRLAKTVNLASAIGTKLNRREWSEFIEFLVNALEQYGLLRKVKTHLDVPGWRLVPDALLLKPCSADKANSPNPFFHDLYRRVATELAEGGSGLLGLEAREHTAQVRGEVREWREWRFRWGEEDRQRLAENRALLHEHGESDQRLPVLYCSPTMELGIDISALNTVYLRNVPPTPANYAQRAGRAGRSGQAAVIYTYCAAQSPHDQYYFQRRKEMVAGQVRPPMIDMMNRDLVRAHLNAVWLAAAELELPGSIPDLLDLERPELPVKEEIRSRLADAEVLSRARPQMLQVLERIVADNEGETPPWMEDAEAFVDKVLRSAAENFERAFDRWRTLYRSAIQQAEDAHAKLQRPGLSEKDRKAAKARWNEAQGQKALLERGEGSQNSDFYTYRYLATEGFLPGYNFPRLPVMAWVPGSDGSKEGATVLQRARFLAISEFGPHALLYHEGRAYRVVQVRLSPDMRVGEGLGTEQFLLCPECGARNDADSERCTVCGSLLEGAERITRALRIENVSCRPAQRITANDEERMRQGFDLRTCFMWPVIGGRPDVEKRQLRAGSGVLADLAFAQRATIWRLNLGLRRRKNEQVHGFLIKPATGYWSRSEGEEDTSETVVKEEDAVETVRVVPMVEDRKNALLMRLPDGLLQDPVAQATVQHALLRGIEIVFQIETGELLAEPLPKADERKRLLFYEASEGGAGVLAQLVEDGRRWHAVARAALEVMHYENVEEAIAGKDITQLKTRYGVECVDACYRCLRSYYNQPDHALIDRGNEAALEFLVTLGAAELTSPSSTEENEVPGSVSPAGRADLARWIETFAEARLPAPDRTDMRLGDFELPFAWSGFLVAAVVGPVPEELEQVAAEKGWDVVSLPGEGREVPERLKALLGGDA